MSKTIFCSSLIFIIYTYLGYPAILYIWSKLEKKRVDKAYIYPRISVIIAVHNEAKNIRKRIHNLLQQDYPKEMYEIIVVSDGSTDLTEMIVREFLSNNVVLVSYKERKGKAYAINKAVKWTKGEIIIFTDARQQFEIKAIQELVANFHDLKVGSVSGELHLMGKEKSKVGEGLDLYWRYEKWMRKKESEIYSIIGVTGAIYAVRRELYEAIPKGTILDDVYIPMKVVMKNYRVVFDSKAKAYDEIVDDHKREFKRKVRTLTGNYQLVKLCPQFLLPIINPLFFRYLSHKICRLLIPFALLGLFISNYFIKEGIYNYLFYGQIVFYFLAISYKWSFDSKIGRFLKLPRTFLVMNFAAFLGAVHFINLGSKGQDVW
ncbi:MAG: glycosyltransferase family 2 protein [bacterium]